LNVQRRVSRLGMEVLTPIERLVVVLHSAAIGCSERQNDTGVRRVYSTGLRILLEDDRDGVVAER
jgi:hypothetical protein